MPTTTDFNYQRYLASREWALLKEEVRKRSGGHCERCVFAPYQETHHITYERIGHEQIHDLLAVCRDCHTFLSGKTDVDPLTRPLSVRLEDAPSVEGGYTPMGCPGCFLQTGDWWANLHIENVTHIKGTDYPSGSFGYRYGAALIHMWCEAGHKFDLVFGDHKGAVFPHGFENIRPGETEVERLREIHLSCPDSCKEKDIVWKERYG